MDELTDVACVDVKIKITSIESDAIKLVQTIKPDWAEEDICVQTFKDGITNRLVGCNNQRDPDDMVLIRVYGEKTELFIDRRLEIRNMNMMHLAGLTPPLYCTFNNGICYGFAPGDVLDQISVRNSVICHHVSKMMATMHTIKPNYGSSNGSGATVKNEPKPCLFKVLRKFIQLYPDALSDAQQNQRFMKLPSKLILEKEVNALEEHLTKLNSPVVFCHNDLLLKNIIYNEQNDKVTFIDFEYGDYNYQAYDLGNHFCEFAGIDSYDPALYPDKKFQMNWLKNYLMAWCELNNESIPVELYDHQLQLLYVQVNKFALASHLLWGLWAVIQAANSSIEFDFIRFSRERLNEYFARKDEYLSMQLPPNNLANGYI